MFKKGSVFITSLLCLTLLASCSQVEDDTEVTSDVVDDTLEYSEIVIDTIVTDIEEPIADIPLNFEPYTTTIGKLDLPAESEYESFERSIEPDKLILGHRSNCEILEYRMLNGDLLRYTICTDVYTNEVFLQGEGITVFDINGDGNNEIKNDGYLLISTSDGIMIADAETPFENYLESILEENATYDFYLGIGSDYTFFKYTVYTQGEEIFEEHNIQAQFVENGFNFIYDQTYVRDIYAPYVSNDPDWDVEVSYTNIQNPHNFPSKEDYIYKLYTLTIYGPNDEQYTIYGYSDFSIDNADNIIRTNEYQDARFDRKLIIHPNYDYALLIYPFFTETASDINMTCATLIDLKTGMITDSNTDIESASTCLYNPYHLFKSDKEAFDELNKYDFMGVNMRAITQDVEISDTGFEVTIHLREANGDIVLSKTMEINLANISTPAS